MTRQWLTFLVLLLLVQISAIGVVYIKHSQRKHFVELQSESYKKDDLLIEYGQLQLEQSTWSAHSRVERIAREKLKMYTPSFSDVKIIYR